MTGCKKAIDGVTADGGKLVNRDAVYSNPPPENGHFIALAVKPPGDADGTGDFHFWRLDANGVWSYKVGAVCVWGGVMVGGWSQHVVG